MGFQGVPGDYGVFQEIMGCSGGLQGGSGMVSGSSGGVPGVFQEVRGEGGGFRVGSRF